MSLLLGLLCGTTQVAAQRYADHSVLASGRWVKMRVPTTGIYQITDSLVSAAGFADASKVRVYGYGGAMQPEKITSAFLQLYDDLKEVPTYEQDGRRLFHAVGTVSWNSAATTARVRNPYSDYGYYFLTDKDDDGQAPSILADSAAFAKSFYPHPSDYHELYEVDDYAWFAGGRNLYDKRLYAIGVPNTYEMAASDSTGTLTVSLSFDYAFQATVTVNGTEVATLDGASTSVISKDKDRKDQLSDIYALAGQYTWNLQLKDILKPQNTITITQTSGKNVRLDYLSLRSVSPKPMPMLTDTEFPTPELVGPVLNQDLHADGPADMVIIIPASRHLEAEAQRLAEMHATDDGLRVRIVDAGQLFNEFSSGTPEANAYRRYLKMLYDRAENESDRPRYLLLFGDGAWDNRMRLDDWRTETPDNFLLCYESDNSYSETKCYVSDDYFCLLDDNEGSDMNRKDVIDVSVGRFPVRTVEEARILVDKTISYRRNEHPGAWQNVLCFMGDDGNNNMHMDDAEKVIRALQADPQYMGYDVRKIYWDAFNRVTSASGERYPDVERLIKQQLNEGALVMNYTGHAKPEAISHERVLSINDFATATSDHLPLWFTASCDIMPFDGQTATIGERAVLNPQGGAIAFFGTARTVFAYYNQFINREFTLSLLGSDAEGRRYTIGDAARLAKTNVMLNSEDRTENKFQYVLLGDPALVLAAPTVPVSIDRINGLAPADAMQRLTAGAPVTVEGSLPGHSDFQGLVTLTLRDAEETIQGLRNDAATADTAIVFKVRQHTVFVGTDSINNGHFRFTFALPMDVSYSDSTAQLLAYAVSDDHRLTGHGEDTSFILGSGNEVAFEGDGPVISCYLNDTTFHSGNTVGQLARFVADIYSEQGINVAGTSFGHDMELVIDGKMHYTYSLNSYYTNAFGDYRRGIVNFTLPVLSAGLHSLRFRAWDVYNNSSTVQFQFVVDPNYLNAIDDLQADDRLLPAAQQLYDASGRRVSTAAPARTGLYIYRDNAGRVKKMMKAGQ